MVNNIKHLGTWYTKQPLNSQCSGKKAHVCDPELLLSRPDDTVMTVTDKFSPCTDSTNLCFQRNLGGWEVFFYVWNFRFNGRYAFLQCNPHSNSMVSKERTENRLQDSGSRNILGQVLFLEEMIHTSETPNTSMVLILFLCLFLFSKLYDLVADPWSLHFLFFFLHFLFHFDWMKLATSFPSSQDIKSPWDFQMLES